MRQLMKQQKLAFKYAKPLARIALFMEMRLGKTLVSIRWSEFNELKRNLVVAPKSVLLDWVDELQKEGYPDEEIHVLPLDTENRLKYVKHHVNKAGWFLTNPETIVYCPEILKENWDCLILDESRIISNPKADITKVLINQSKDIDYRAILSGCPAPETEKDYCEQFRFLYDGRFMCQSDYWWWRQKYYMKAGYNWVPRPGTIKAIKEEVSKYSFTMTAKEAGIGNKKIYQKRMIETNDTQKKMSARIKKDFEFKHEGKFVMSKHVIVNMTWLQQIAGGFTPKGICICNNKFVEIYQLLKSDLKDKSVVIWFKHNAEIAYCLKYLRGKKISCAVYTGVEKADEYAFKQGKRQVMLAQAKCGKYGKNWSVASTAIYYSNWWSNETRLQTEKRIEHPKKNEPLLYIDFISENTVDEDVFKALGKKYKTTKDFTAGVIKNWRLRNERL